MRIEQVKIFLIGFLLGLILMIVLGFNGTSGNYQASLSNGDLVILNTNTGIANYYYSGKSQPKIIEYFTAEMLIFREKHSFN